MKKFFNILIYLIVFACLFIGFAMNIDNKFIFPWKIDFNQENTNGIIKISMQFVAYAFCIMLILLKIFQSKKRNIFGTLLSIILFFDVIVAIILTNIWNDTNEIALISLILQCCGAIFILISGFVNLVASKNNKGKNTKAKKVKSNKNKKNLNITESQIAKNEADIKKPSYIDDDVFVTVDHQRQNVNNVDENQDFFNYNSDDNIQEKVNNIRDILGDLSPANAKLIDEVTKDQQEIENKELNNNQEFELEELNNNDINDVDFNNNNNNNDQEFELEELNNNDNNDVDFDNNNYNNNVNNNENNINDKSINFESISDSLLDHDFTDQITNINDFYDNDNFDNNQLLDDEELENSFRSDQNFINNNDEIGKTVSKLFNEINGNIDNDFDSNNNNDQSYFSDNNNNNNNNNDAIEQKRNNIVEPTSISNLNQTPNQYSNTETSNKGKNSIVDIDNSAVKSYYNDFNEKVFISRRRKWDNVTHFDFPISNVKENIRKSKFDDNYKKREELKANYANAIEKNVSFGKKSEILDIMNKNIQPKNIDYVESKIEKLNDDKQTNLVDDFDDNNIYAETIDIIEKKPIINDAIKEQNLSLNNQQQSSIINSENSQFQLSHDPIINSKNNDDSDDDDLIPTIDW